MDSHREQFQSIENKLYTVHNNLIWQIKLERKSFNGANFLSNS
jgi:hypothetical protein